ncbi:MAG: hypothetical protein JO316_06005 [Abitibacteriaceae bacterium]|nr:hypothetical protein [Abditibacteriaceae bacterium]
MTLTIDLSPEIEQQLAAKAQQNGQSLQEYALTVLVRDSQVIKAIEDVPASPRCQRVLQGYGKLAQHGPTIEQRRQWKDEEIALGE